MKLEEKLVSLRKKKGLTQLQAAEAVGVSRQAISKWEAGSVVPSSDNLRRLGELYEVSTDFLLQENSNPSIQDKIEVEKNEVKVQGKPTLSPKSIIAIVAVLAAVIIMGIMVVASSTFDGPKGMEFDEMGSDQWESFASEEFSVKTK